MQGGIVQELAPPNRTTTSRMSTLDLQKMHQAVPLIRERSRRRPQEEDDKKRGGKERGVIIFEDRHGRIQGPRQGYHALGLSSPDSHAGLELSVPTQFIHVPVLNLDNDR